MCMQVWENQRAACSHMEVSEPIKRVACSYPLVFEPIEEHVQIKEPINKRHTVTCKSQSQSESNNQSLTGQRANQKAAYSHMQVSEPIREQQLVTCRSGTVSLAMGWKYLPVIFWALSLGPTAAYNCVRAASLR